jgi:microcystin-dependent protein
VPEPVVRTLPPPGTVNPGNLYVDSATRVLWLGVDTSVDSDGIVLVTDHEAALAAAAQAETDANAYTDTAIVPLAPKASPVFTGTPTAPTAAPGTNTQQLATTQFVQAAVALPPPTSSWQAGMIVPWGGKLSAIGVGALADWHLCNGDPVSRADYAALWTALGTMHGAGDGATTFNLPDLQDRFILGGGSNRTLGSKNLTTATADTNSTGSHVHTIQSTTLTAAQIPSHVHSSGTLAGTCAVSGNTGVAGTHTHPITALGISAGGGPAAVASSWTPNMSMNTGAAAHTGTGASGADHFHTVSLSGTIDVSSGNTGNPTVAGGQAHTHGMNTGAGIHAHTVSATELREAVPFVALCYIIRLK